MIAHTTNQRPGINHGQPTLSQQIRRLEEIIGTPLLQRRREGLRLTPAGSVLLDTADVDLIWMEAALDAGFSLIQIGG